jgi:hypothetical protein
MYPLENLGIQLGLEIGHGMSEHMAFFACANSHIIFFCTDPAYLCNLQKENSPLGAKDQAIPIFLLLPGLSHPGCRPLGMLALFPGMLKSDPQPLAGEWLQ